MGEHRLSQIVVSSLTPVVSCESTLDLVLGRLGVRWLLFSAGDRLLGDRCLLVERVVSLSVDSTRSRLLSHIGLPHHSS